MEVKTILLLTPQFGSVSSPGVKVMFTGSVPLVFIMKMSNCPSLRLDEKAILLPSGDHVGLLSTAVLLVSLVSPEPSWFMTYISKLPSRFVAKAIFVPSGENTG